MSLDDIFIATKTLEEHLAILEEVFDILAKFNLELRIDKCHFLKLEIGYLGYTISERGIKPNSENIRSVQNFPIPKSSVEVQSFLGLCSYFRKFVENFAIIAKPLYDLIRKNVEFKFGSEELKSFEVLKGKLIDSPILSVYSLSDETELHCDASKNGFGAILLQKKKDERFHPIFYFSKRTSDAESKYHSYELETLAVIYALTHSVAIYF